MKKILMPAALTAENGAKALMMGEFEETISVECSECDGKGTHIYGFGSYKCEICDGDGFLTKKVPVSWTTIKEIYAMAVKHFWEEQ